MGLVRGSSIHSVGVQINSELRTECAASAQPGHIAAVTAPCLPAAEMLRRGCIVRVRDTIDASLLSASNGVRSKLGFSQCVYE